MLAVVGVSIALPIAVRLLLNTTASSFEHQTLQRHQLAIAGSLHWTSAGWRLDLPAELKTMYAQGYSGFAYAILDRRGGVLFSSLTNHGALFPAKGREDQVMFYQRPHGAAVYYGASLPVRRGPAFAWVQVAQDLQNPDVIVDDIVSAFLKQVAWLILPFLILLVLVDYIIVRRALSPVLEASELAKGIGPATLSLRLPEERLPIEIAPLAHAMNQALDRLEQGFRTQREFTADAAHELRTPLAILKMHVGALADKEVGRALARNFDVMTRIVGQLLDVAELESFVLDPSEVADLRDLGSRVVEYMAPMALAKGRELSLTGTSSPVLVHGDGDILFQAIRNLVENALSHTGPGTVVEVKVEPQGVIRVLDRGPGIAEAERELLFQRFWRRDRRKSEGAGLGLAIVWRIIQAHDGEVSVHNRPGGGAAFTIRLNRAPRSGDRRRPAERAEHPNALAFTREPGE